MLKSILEFRLKKVYFTISATFGTKIEKHFSDDEKVFSLKCQSKNYRAAGLYSFLSITILAIMKKYFR